MNEYEKTIEVLQNRVSALEELMQPIGSRPTVKQWQPKGGWHCVTTDGYVRQSHSTKDFQLNGVERETKEQAQRAAVEMRRFNRLLALRDELCGEKEVDWTDNESIKWILYFDYKDNEWITNKNQYMQTVGIYFANKASAQKACDMLNSGEVKI